jgi:hypothetical protein
MPLRAPFLGKQIVPHLSEIISEASASNLGFNVASIV